MATREAFCHDSGDTRCWSSTVRRVYRRHFSRIVATVPIVVAFAFQEACLSPTTVATKGPPGLDVVPSRGELSAEYKTGQRIDDFRFCLTERTSFPMPQNVVASGGVYLEPYGALLWSHQDSMAVLIRPRGPEHKWRVGDGKILAGRIDDSGAAELFVDEQKKETPAVRGHNLPMTIRYAPALKGHLHAVWWGDDWYGLMHGDSVTDYIVQLLEGEAVRVHQPAVYRDKHGPEGQYFSSASDSAAALISVSSYPFRVLYYNAVSETHSWLVPALGEDAMELSQGWWRSIGAVFLDEGRILQEIVDLRSDRRLFIFYGRKQKAVVRQTGVEVPLGIIASDPVNRALLVGRQLGKRDLAVYEWAWGDGSCVNRDS